VLARVLDVEARLRDNPTEARESLRRLFKDGRIALDRRRTASTWRAATIGNTTRAHVGSHESTSVAARIRQGSRALSASGQKPEGPKL